MAFQIKDFASIAASMVNWMRSVQSRFTDFNVGSTARTLVEAPATEIDELYQQAFNGLKEAIPVSVYNSFDFSALPAIPAGGLVTVTIQSSSAPVVITSGTVFTPASGGATYTALQNVTIPPASTTAQVSVVAISPGVAGNIPASSTFTLNPAPTGFISATNASPFINGSDAETDDARKDRIRAFVQSLSRGTGSAVLFGLRTAFLLDDAGNTKERVVSASLVEPWRSNPMQPIGLVKCYIHNGIGSTSSSLVDEAQRVVDGYYDSNNRPVPGYKAAGVKVEVAAADEVAVDVTAEITPLTGFNPGELCMQATYQVTAYILALDIGMPALFAEIVRIVQSIPGVANFRPSAPDNMDVDAEVDEKLMPGDIDITPA